MKGQRMESKKPNAVLYASGVSGIVNVRKIITALTCIKV